MQANKRLNGVYTEFLETEDELVALAKKLKRLKEKFAELKGIEKMSDKIQKALENLTELEEETEKIIGRIRITHIMWQEDKRHEQKVHTLLKTVAWSWSLLRRKRAGSGQWRPSLVVWAYHLRSAPLIKRGTRTTKTIYFMSSCLTFAVGSADDYVTSQLAMFAILKARFESLRSIKSSSRLM